MSSGVTLRTDEADALSLTYTFDSRVYYFPREYMGLLGGILLERDRGENSDARATALGLELGMRLQGPPDQVALFFETGFGLRRYEYEARWYSIDDLKLGINFAGGVSLPLGDALQADISLQHHLNHKDDEIIYPLAGISPFQEGSFYTPQRIPGEILNPSGIRLAMRWKL